MLIKFWENVVNSIFFLTTIDHKYIPVLKLFYYTKVTKLSFQ